MDEGQIIKVIYQTMEEFSAQYDGLSGLDQSPDTRLAGEGGCLDSLGLVKFVVAVENRIRQASGLGISLDSELTMSRKRSPFLTVNTLARHVRSRIGQLSGKERSDE